MTQLESKADFDLASKWLRRRGAETLAEFLLSLAQDSGPVGAQVRTFIVGNDIGQTVQSVRQRISGLAGPSEYAHRHALGREVGTHLDFIVDSVERLVLSKDARAAFELLLSVFAADAVAMENCGEHACEVVCAFQRAVKVMSVAAKQLPRAEVEEKIRALLDSDGYGVRALLAAVISEDPDGT